MSKKKKKKEQMTSENYRGKEMRYQEKNPPQTYNQSQL